MTCMCRPRSASFLLLGLMALCLAFLATASPAAAQTCTVDETTMCLGEGGRFQVTATWANRQGQSGDARMVALTRDSGYFTFFMESNVEGVIKVLDGCAISDHFWVFAGGLTNLRVELTVVDTLTGESVEYVNALRTVFKTVFDNRAFNTCEAGGGNGLAAGELAALSAGERAALASSAPPAELVSRLMPDLAEIGERAAAEARAVTPRLQRGLDVIDLADVTIGGDPVSAESVDGDHVLTIYGPSDGEGRRGVPVAGGVDVDGDGELDAAMASFLASPEGRERAGRVAVLLSEQLGLVAPTSRDFGVDDPPGPVLQVIGAGPQETAGNEIWMDDVTGDGIGDVLICRQNHTPLAGRPGAGALTILAGGPALSTFAATGAVLDLASPAPEVPITTLVGADRLGRFCMWVRSGDVDGDGVADLVVGADQEAVPGTGTHAGLVYVIRGGDHLTGSGAIDMALFDRGYVGTPLAGQVARLAPPPGSSEYHFGATTSVADLDGNGRAEVITAAALARGGAGIPAEGQPASTAHSSGGSPSGTVYIVWDDNFPVGPWPDQFDLAVDDLSGTQTVLRGGPGNRNFGEETLGGDDWDGDGLADFYAGDLTADVTFLGTRPFSGMGMVFYDAASLKGMNAAIDALPSSLDTTTLIGADPGDIAGDTAVSGDFDGDGVDDLAVSSPHATVKGRESAGTFHVLHGQAERWPELIDLAEPPVRALRITQVLGGKGATGLADQGDTLAYSMAVGDMDRDGRPDLLFNEMLGNQPDGGATDVGNLVILSGRAISDGGPCTTDGGALCLRGGRFRVTATWRLDSGLTGEARGEAITDEAGYFVFFRDSNLELLVKVLDGCGTNGNFWFFSTGLTNVGVQLVVEDLATGAQQVYTHGLNGTSPRGAGYEPMQDTRAFPTC